MARLGYDGAFRYFVTTSTRVTAAPLTMAVWYNMSQDAEGVFLSLCDSGAANSYFGLDYTDTGTLIRAYARSGSTAVASVSATGGTGTWKHAAGVFGSSTSRYAYFNGTAGTEETTDITPTSLDRLGLLCLARDVADGAVRARLADAGIWNVALSAAEIGILAAGVSPLLVRPESLMHYWPLMGITSSDNEVDLMGGTTMTAQNSPAVYAHPRVLRAANLRVPIFEPAAAAPTFVPRIIVF